MMKAQVDLASGPDTLIHRFSPLNTNSYNELQYTRY